VTPIKSVGIWSEVSPRGIRMKFRSFPSRPMNSPSSKITLSLTADSVLLRIVTVSSGVKTQAAKSEIRRALINDSSAELDGLNTPCDQTVTSAS
jgi:hypothetical protein